MSTTTTVHVLDEKYSIKHENGLNIRATRYHEEWRTFTGDKLMYMLVTRYAEMEQLLHQVNEATGPGATEQALPDAITAIDNFLRK